MRIVSGKFGGRKLLVPKGKDIRPTSDKVRGAIFNALQSRGVVDGAYVLDCFCGTGALGLEALSRGAEHCIFIDKNRTSLDLAKENVQNLGADHAEFILRDAAALGARPDNIAPANLIFLDPPYNQTLLAPTLLTLHNHEWVKGGAFVVAEVEKSFDVGKEFSEELVALYELLDERTYGDTKILFLLYSHSN